MKWIRASKASGLVLSVSLFAACADTDVFEGRQPTIEGTTSGTIADVLANDPRFTVLATALDETGLIDALDDTSADLTLFAPVDAAFVAMPNDVIAASNFVASGNRDLLGISVDGATLAGILQAHVVPGSQSSTAVLAASALTTINESTITVTSVNPTPEDRPGEDMDTFPVLSGRVQLIETDITANNGVIHVVDAVFIPSVDPFPGNLFELMSATPLFQPFLTLLRDAGLDATIGEFNTDAEQNTVFMPAFGLSGVERTMAASGDVARGHIFPGTTLAAAVVAADGTDFENGDTLARYAIDGNALTIEGTSILFADLRAANGVVHLTFGPVGRPDDTVADIITTTGDLSSLRGALSAIEPDGSAVDADSTQTLLDALRADEVTTVFAPNNAAFAALAGIDADLNNDEPDANPDDDVEPVTDNALELVENGELDELLTYHVTPVGVVINAMTMPGAVATRNGSTVDLGRFGMTMGGMGMPASSGTTTLNDIIEVLSTSTTQNGSVVHTIGNVLVPGGLSTLPVLDDNFPGSNQEAIEYFTLFSGFAGLADGAYPIRLSAGGSAVTFGGTLADILAFVDGDAANLVAMDPAFMGQLVEPYSVDTDEDGTADANIIDIPTATTVFVPVSPSFPASVPDFVFDTDNDNFTAADIGPFHVVGGTVLAADIMDDAAVPTFVLTRANAMTMDPGGATGLLDISIDLDTLTVNGGGTSGALLKTDLQTENGVIHVIDDVLSPAATPDM
ncbi:MAG: fasciclin domain-containing protein [Myxococcota bacterium]